MWGFPGFGYGYGYEDPAPWGSAVISQRAEGKLEQAKSLFDNHIALVDVSEGPVSGTRARARCVEGLVGAGRGCWVLAVGAGGGRLPPCPLALLPTSTGHEGDCGLPSGYLRPGARAWAPPHAPALPPPPPVGVRRPPAASPSPTACRLHPLCAEAVQGVREEVGRQAHLQVNGRLVGAGRWVPPGPAYAQPPARPAACTHRPRPPRPPTGRFESKPGRKSKVCFTSVTITAAAQKAFLAERPGQVAVAQAAAAAEAQAAAEKAAKKAAGKKGGKKAAAGGAENAEPAAKRGKYYLPDWDASDSD